MEDKQYISVDLQLDDEGKALTVEVFYRAQPLNVLGTQSPLKPGEHIQISTDEITQVDQNRCRPAPAMVRHFADNLDGLKEVIICDQGTMMMRFDRPLREEQLDEIASTLAKQLCVIVPLSVMLALT